jgi:hypothetical protein
LLYIDWNGKKTISVHGLKNVIHEKNLMKGALRIGNGGFFVFSGWFRSKKLGWFHLVGNGILSRPVLLECEDKKWIVTPENPDECISILNEQIESRE